ncbi:OLC1v1018447C1 [Oldenlandia corymbosa var. corymbosa]|nr:OLC1v1018447C1 [Oldenlandia corymbosa var. corymbosa]
MGTVHGSSLVTGPTSTPLPDRTMLVFVLDRLQKKDTYGVFSEPVDPNELPDYHEIIEQPMDFGTVRKKLDDGVYTNLEELEADVMLICSNAMQYNSSDTVYYRQARSIQELAKRDFENLRNEGDDGEPQPKVVRRGRPPSKNLKKPIETSPSDRVGLEVSSGATLATGEDKASGSNGYNLRKGQSMLYKLRSNDASSGTSFRTRNGENYSDWLVDWNSEFPANILRADMKYGKKHFTMIDETRRDTYKQSHPLPSSSNQSYFSNSFGDMKRLMSVGLHMDPHAYARSLARYAANLGPVAWNVASRKLKSVLPDGLAFGPGWVEENDLPLPFLPDKLKSMNTSVPNHDYSGKMVNPSTSELSSVHRPPGEIADAGRRSSSQNELPNQGSGLSWAIPCSGNSFQTPPQKAIFHPNRNGFNGMIGFDMSSQMGVAQVAATQAGHSGWDNQILPGRQSAGNVAALHSGPQYPPKSAEAKLSDNWALARSGNSLNQASDSQMVSAMHRQSPAIPPDLNIRVQATSGSPSSSLQIGSPQPDLALQL